MFVHTTETSTIYNTGIARAPKRAYRYKWRVATMRALRFVILSTVQVQYSYLHVYCIYLLFMYYKIMILDIKDEIIHGFILGSQRYILFTKVACRGKKVLKNEKTLPERYRVRSTIARGHASKAAHPRQHGYFIFAFDSSISVQLPLPWRSTKTSCPIPRLELSQAMATALTTGTLSTRAII